MISGDNPNTSFKPNATTAEQASSSNTSAGGTISFGGGKKVEVAETPTSIEDKDGKIYAVDEQGKVTKAAEKTKETESLAGNMSTREKEISEGEVRFSAYKNQNYAFDEYQGIYESAGEYKNKYEEFGGEKVAVKAIAPGKPDKVSIQFDGDVPVDSIYFLTPAGVRYRAEKDNGGYYLNLIGGEANETQEVYAMLRNRQDTTKPSTIGKLIVAAYPRQEKNLILVPVNVAKVDTAGVLKKINEIYNPVNVYWTIKIAENFENKTWDIDKDDALNVTGSKWYTTYTEEMKALKTAYSQANNIDQRTLYMFVMKKAKTDNETSSKTIVGDMPRGKQFGFLFTEGVSNKEQLAKTIAHELGHGYFQLKHPFEMGLNKEQLPDNLMDYAGGTTFNKYEWDLMHDPGIVTGLFESDTSGQLIEIYIAYRIAKEIIKTGSVGLSFDVVYELTKSLYNYFTELPKKTNAVLKVDVPIAKEEQLLENLISKSEDVLVVCLALTTEFAQGIGTERREFNENHTLSKSLKNCNATTLALKEWYKGYMDYINGTRITKTLPERWALSFPQLQLDKLWGNTNPLVEYWKDEEFTTIQFIGSATYLFNFNEQTQILYITVEDNKNHNSMFLHVSDEKYDRSKKKEFGTTYQTYKFSISLNDIKKRLQIP
ncbi:MAG: hypothetical protein ACRCUS_08000 [Anaerovoracaceae bacterium]